MAIFTRSRSWDNARKDARLADIMHLCMCENRSKGEKEKRKKKKEKALFNSKRGPTTFREVFMGTIVLLNLYVQI